MKLLKANFFKSLKTILIIALVTLVLLEICVAIYVHSNSLKIEIPTYSFTNTHSFWYDLNEDFGTLHLPNDTYRQKKTCYDVTYFSNLEGFRDVDRSLHSEQNRVVVLGDSFIEGYGLDQENRLTNILEADTKTPHLNFGLAGNFGPTQYYILYKTLAKKYNHDAILVGILPSNDFIDDDYDINIKYGSNRYRPFLKGDYPNYKVVYYADTITKSKARPRTVGFKSKLLKNFSYTFALYNYGRTKSYIQNIPKESILPEKQIPSYFNYTKAQFDRLKFTLEQLKANADGKKLMVFTIPIYKEIIKYRETKQNPLGKDLKKFCNTLGIEYLDLLPETNILSLKQCEALFLACDGHWSVKGSLFTRQAIKQNFTYYKMANE